MRAARKLGRVGLADDDRARRAQPPHRRLVVRGDALGVEARAGCPRQPRDRHRVFHGDGQAVQVAARRWVGEAARLEVARGRARGVPARDRQRVDDGVGLLGGVMVRGVCAVARVGGLSVGRRPAQHNRIRRLCARAKTAAVRARTGLLFRTCQRLCAASTSSVGFNCGDDGDWQGWVAVCRF